MIRNVYTHTYTYMTIFVNEWIYIYNGSNYIIYNFTYEKLYVKIISYLLYRYKVYQHIY